MFQSSHRRIQTNFVQKNNENCVIWIILRKLICIIHLKNREMQKYAKSIVELKQVKQHVVK